jgi:CelD/BcsL family acetyltransferase involved in cellulose biosynthesis
MLRTAAEVGLRRGEVIGLRWTDLDLPARRITFRRSVWQARGKTRERIIGRPRGGKERNDGPLGLSESPASRYARPVGAGGADPKGYVGPGRGGEPMGTAPR